MILTVTGHRKVVPAGLVGSAWPEQNPQVAEHHLKVVNHMTEYCWRQHTEHGCNEFISGMAIGADQLFARAVIALKDALYPVRLTVAIPFNGQECKWPAHSQTEYNNILARADERVVVCKGSYAPWKMQKRNEWMVDRATDVLALWDATQSGGTFNCIKYALSEGKPVVGLHPQTLTYGQINFM